MIIDIGGSLRTWAQTLEALMHICQGHDHIISRGENLPQYSIHVDKILTTGYQMVMPVTTSLQNRQITDLVYVMLIIQCNSNSKQPLETSSFLMKIWVCRCEVFHVIVLFCLDVVEDEFGELLTSPISTSLFLFSQDPTKLF